MLAHDINQGKRTKDVQISQNIKFDTMMLSPNTLQGLQTSGFYQPSPIQLQAIPLGKCGFDLLLEAKSGTGKTVVFTVIALEKLDLTKGLQTIILTPTREIAAQIYDVIKQIGVKYEGLNVESVIGGLPVKEDVEKFRQKTVHIIVGSPGRLRHLISDKHIDTSTIRLLVIDEADKLMEKSFKNDINYIYKALPNEKQVIMSSATYTDTSKIFINQYVQNAQHICPDNNSVLLGIEQKVTTVKYSSNVVVQTQNRFQELLSILSQKQFKQCLVFCNYQARVAELYKLLKQSKWPAEQLYGQQEQTDRLDALKTLKAYKCRILVSTDLAARGIDASNVDLIINFEPPYEWQTYLHRIGRAGRYGTYGIAVTILSEGKEQKTFKEMLISMNGSLHLTDFWNNSKFLLENESFSSLESNPVRDTKELEHHSINLKKNSNYCKELWKELTCERKTVTDTNIEKFDSLNNSFEATKNIGIESFSDLLQSFQNNQCNIEDTDISFHYIKMPEIAVKKYSVNQMKSFGCNFDEHLSKKSGQNKDLENVSHVFKKLSYDEHNTENYIYFSNKMETEKSEIILTDEDNNIESKHTIDLVSASESCNNKANMLKRFAAHEDNNSEKKDHTNVTEEAFLCEDLSNILQAVGLPTSFHNSKDFTYKCFRDKQKGNAKRYNSNKISNHILEESENKKPFLEYQEMLFSKPESKSNVSKKDKKYAINSMRNANDDRALSYKHSTLTALNMKEDRMKRYFFEAKEREGSDCGNHANEDNVANCQITNYFNWYNQFKYTMKYIELTMYLEEIFKL